MEEPLDGAIVTELLDKVRAKSPLVQNITNLVSMDISANALLALGASPAMVHAEEEAPDFVAVADALVVNIGTLSAPWLASMTATTERAAALGKPWAFDPVAVGATPFRTRAAHELVRRRPTAIRGNASEIMALADMAGGGKGVDSLHGSDQAVEAAASLAASTGAVVAVTGRVDYVTDGRRTVRIANGHPLMTRVTAVGCAATALVGAFLAVGEDPLQATAAALATMGVAGDIAAEGAAGPGSFRVALLDALYRIDGRELARRADIS